MSKNLSPVVKGVEFTTSPSASVENEGKLASELALARELASKSLSGNTLKNYRSHWNLFAAWCESNSLVSIPADPETVCLHLAALAAEVEQGKMKVDDSGRPVRGTLRPASIRMRLSAINKAHQVAGLDAPGDNGKVKAVIAGINRTFGTRNELAKAAADLPILKQLLLTSASGSFELLRDKVLFLLLSYTDISAGQAARLTWSDISFEDTEVSISFFPASRSKKKTTVSVETSELESICLVSHLKLLFQRSKNMDGVFVSSAGKVLSRQAIWQTQKRFEKTVSFEELKDVSPLELMSIVETVFESSSKSVRDQALLLTGWFGAMRRSNIASLSWGDLYDDDGEYSVLLRRSKTDQEGQGHTIWLPFGESSEYPCPATAMTLWREFVAKELGSDPIENFADYPVFCSVDRHGNLKKTKKGRLKRVTGDSICELIQTLVEKSNVGLGSDFGAHSLRAGFITEALKDEKLSITEVQEVSGHKSVDMLIRYNRQVNAKKNNPARKLIMGKRNE